MTTTTKPSGLQTMKHRLERVQAIAYELTVPYGYVPASKRYRYDELVQEAVELKNAIETWERLGINKGGGND